MVSFPPSFRPAAGSHPSRSYLATRVLTAPPHVLVLMLLDGALREAGRARAVDVSAPGGREQLHRALTRAQDFLRELLLALDREKGGDLAARLASLYLFCQQRLIEANVKADPKLCDEVIQVLRPLREAWAQLGRAVPGDGGAGGQAGPAGTAAGSPGTLGRA